MVLFLTSSPCDDDVPKHMHLPCCYFERNDFVKNLKKYWKQNSRCVIIAAYPENYELNDEMAFTFRRCFLYHGMIPESFVLIDRRNEEDTERLVKNSEVVLLGGGHVPTEMEFFRRINLAEIMKDYQGLVMGISAGSMNAAKRVYCMPEEKGEGIDPDFVKHFPGLGLTEYNIIPHYNLVKDNILDGRRLFEDWIFEDSYGETFYELMDGSYILQVDGKAGLYGEAYLIENGEMQPFNKEGEHIDL